MFDWNEVFGADGLFTPVSTPPTITFPGSNVPIPSLPGFGTPPIAPTGVPSAPSPGLGTTLGLGAMGATNAITSIFSGITGLPATLLSTTAGQVLQGVERFTIDVLLHGLVNLIAVMFAALGLYLLFKPQVDSAVKQGIQAAKQAATDAALA